MFATDPVALAMAIAAAPLSAVLVTLALRYARARGLLDAPGQRRSHALPTPRGGGIGIVIALLIALGVLAFRGALEPGSAGAIAAALVAVGAIGWLDDHRPQPVRWRLLVHVLAAAALVASIAGLPPGPLDLAWTLALVLGVVAAVNFWNFMDGIDGLATLQALYCALGLVFLLAAAGAGGPALLALALAAACLGFLPFNLPRARIFLGDVGSGALGLAVAALGLLALDAGAASTWQLAMLGSAFWLDAGLTLGWRMLRGARWYHPHREHLYQWLVRRGRSHGQVAVGYLGWNLLVVSPALWLSAGGRVAEPAALGAVAMAGAVGWMALRRALLREARTTPRRKPARWA